MGKIVGVLEVGFVTGSAIGTVMGGLISDASDSYILAFIIGAVAILVVAVLILLIGSQRQSLTTG